MAVFTRDVGGSEYFDKDTQNNNTNGDTCDSEDISNDSVVSDSINNVHDDAKYDVVKGDKEMVMHDKMDGNGLGSATENQDDSEDLTEHEEDDEEQEEVDTLQQHESTVMEATSKLITWKDKIDSMSKTAFAMRIIHILHDSIQLLPNTTSANMCCNPYGQSVKQKLNDIKHKVQDNDSACIDRVISTYVNYVQHFDTSVPDSSVYLFFSGVATLIGFLYNIHASRYDFDKMVAKKTFMNPITLVCALVAVVCSGVAFMDISCSHDTPQSKLRLMYIPKLLGKQVYATHLRAKDAVSVIQAISNFISADKVLAESVPEHNEDV